ncbi:MAG TPA: hypothetical protein VLL72_04795 [Kiloniellales bacterium]|nr:hypothetical protein [Kiloniellales bacterium]
MIKMLILICAVGLSRADCQPEVARVVMTGPDTDNPVACMFTGQAYLAGSAIEVGEDEYVKVLCRRPGPIPSLAQLPTKR